MIENLVSTVIPVYNRGAMLREAVASVLAQSWRPIEIVIVDDGSTDDTVQVAEQLRGTHPDIIRVARQANAGPGAARQAGLELTRGEFVQFLDSDDLLLPDKFNLQVRALRTDTEAGISYGKCYSSNNGVREAQSAQATGEKHWDLFPALLDGPLWPTHTPLYRRSAIDAIGPWPNCRLLEDWLYDAQAGVAGIKLSYVDEFVAETRNHDGDRLCRRWQNDVAAMKDRLAAYPIVLTQSRKAGVSAGSPESQRFARTLFWLARMAASQGLIDEASELLRLAEAQTATMAWDMRAFRAVAALLGWQRASRWAEAIRGRRGAR
jgi:glycosyltransferase involved in cell wall biosynthesis